MREIVIDGKTYEVRGLTRGEVKELRKDGFDLSFLRTDKAEEAVDRVFELVFEKNRIKAIDNLPNIEALGLFKAVLKETYGDPGEEKNSSGSGNGTQTRSG